MELIRGFHSLKLEHQNCVLAIGNFDGVHKGHQHILAQVKKVGEQENLPVIVMVFEPYPIEFFSPQKAQARLSRLREKLIDFQRYGVEKVLLVSFNHHFSRLSPQEFIEDYLVKQLRIRYLVAGDDFHFGYNRKGDFDLLKKAGQIYGFDVIKMETLTLHQRRVSSTWVREALAQGDLVQAESLLGRPYSMCGRIAYGDQLGRKLGFPTANIHLHRHLSPLLGIYAVNVHGLGSHSKPGAAYIGNRPAIGGTRSLLEVYLFNFDESIYGYYVQVDFVHKIRDDQHFESLALLKEQIEKDVTQARQFFHL